MWSDQYGHRIQIVGPPSQGKLAPLAGDRPANLHADDSATVVDNPRTFMKLREMTTNGASVAGLELPLTVPGASQA